MEDYKQGSHTAWDCKYHLVWMIKYRYQVLRKNATDEVWKEYIKHRKPPESDDDFTVV